MDKGSSKIQERDYREGKKQVSFASKRGQAMDLCASLSHQYVCCGVHVLKAVSNCPFECTYCFLQNYLTNTTTYIVEDAEALWKETPVVAGNAGGIPLQMPGDLGDYLVNSVEECADKIAYLLENPALCRSLGRKGKEVVNQNFLMPRLIRDELTLIKDII